MSFAQFAHWLTKQDAAARIGVSTKTVEALEKAGKLQSQKTKRDGHGAWIVVYHPEDVERQRVVRQVDPGAFVLPAEAGTNHTNNNQALEAPAPAPPPPLQLLATLIEAVQRAVSEKSQKIDRLFLTVDEAAELSGLPAGTLRRLLRDGRFPGAIRTGRGWRIKRIELEQL